VAMAQDQPVDLPRIDAEQIEIAGEDLWRVPEIQQVLRLGAAILGFEMQR